AAMRPLAALHPLARLALVARRIGRGRIDLHPQPAAAAQLAFRLAGQLQPHRDPVAGLLDVETLLPRPLAGPLKRERARLVAAGLALHATAQRLARLLA